MGKENHTPPRSVRVPDEIWNAATDKARREGTTVSAVVLSALVAYVGPPRERRSPS